MKKQVNIDYESLENAHNIIKFSNQGFPASEEEQSLLAAAYFTLACGPHSSKQRSKMHLNAAVAVLQNTPNRTKAWASQMAMAYFKRAELLEDQGAITAAVHDYQKVIEVLGDSTLLQSEIDRMLASESLVAKVALAAQNTGFNCAERQIALLDIKEAQALLGSIENVTAETISLLVTTYQTAGNIFSKYEPEAAETAYRYALQTAFRLREFEVAMPLISNLYDNLAELQQNYAIHSTIKPAHYEYTSQEMIYLGLSLLFRESHEDEENLTLNGVIELIYHLTDFYTLIVSPQVLRDTLDALIYAYSAMNSGTLPNQTFLEECKDPESLSCFAEHVLLLLHEYDQRMNAKINSPQRLLALTEPQDMHLSTSILKILENEPSKVYQLDEKRAQKLPRP